MHAIGQHERLSLANGLLQMFSQADKLRTVSRGMPGVNKKIIKKKRIFESQNWKSNANPPNEYSNNRIFWSSPNFHKQCAASDVTSSSVHAGHFRAIYGSHMRLMAVAFKWQCEQQRKKNQISTKKSDLSIKTCSVNEALGARHFKRSHDTSSKT